MENEPHCDLIHILQRKGLICKSTESEMAKDMDRVELDGEEKHKRLKTMDTEKPAYGPFSVWSHTGLLIFPEGINMVQSNQI